MDWKESIKRIREAIKEETNAEAVDSLRAVASGISNFHLGLATDTARNRYENFCKGCAFNVHEPIEDMRVQDKTIPELSERMCGDCGCVLSYKLRQSVKLCRFWK